MLARPVRQPPMEFPIPQRWPPLVFTREEPEEPLTREEPQLLPQAIPPYLPLAALFPGVAMLRTPPSRVLLRPPCLPPVLMRVPPVRTLAWLAIPVRLAIPPVQEPFPEQVRLVVRLVCRETARGAVANNSKPVRLRTHC